MANSKILEIVIKAKDEATETLKSFSNTLKKNEADLKAVAVASGATFAGISALAISAIKNAGEAQQVQAQLGAVIKSTGGIAGVSAEMANELASSLQKVTTFGDEAILSAQNMLLTFTNIGKEVFPEATQTVLDMSVALGQDLKSSSIQLGKALNNPIDGITALTRVGVKFTDEQKEMITSLVESGKTMEAQKVILKELGMEFGGSALAQAQTFSGQLMQVKELTGDLSEAIGNALLPALDGVVSVLAPTITKMIEWIEKHPTLVAVITGLTLVISGLVFVLTSLSVALIAVQVAMGPVAWAITGIATLITLALIPAIMLLITHWDLLKQGAVTAFTNIGENLLFFFNLAKLKFDGFLLNIQVFWNNVKGFFKSGIDALTGYFEPLFKTIDKVLSSLDRVIDKAKSIGGSIAKKVSGKAIGGGVQLDKTYLVGEKGPELFRPSSNGSIIPNNKLAGAGGMNLTINMNGGTYLDDNVAEKIGDQIIQNFKRISRI